MKLIVNPGLPRSGTTYLFRQLAAVNRHLFNVPRTKETNIFHLLPSLEKFQEIYPSKDETKAYLDFSPAYLVGRAPAIDNFLAFEASEKKVILSLRNPVDQFFAFYLHDIKAHFSTRQFGDNVRYPLFSRRSLEKYLSMRADAVQKIVDTIGKENVFVVNFHKDLANGSSLSARLGRFLGLDLRRFSDEKVGGGGWMPYYVYGGEVGLELYSGERIRILPKKSLLLVNGDHSMLWENVERDLAAVLIDGSTSWARELTAEQCKILHDAVQSDWNRIVEMLGLEEADYPYPRSLTAGIAPMPTPILEKFQATATLAMRVEGSSFRSGLAPLAAAS